MKTTLDKKQLWTNIRQYHFNTLVPEHLWDQVVSFFGGDDAATKAFADKLSRKHNWQQDFAMLAIREYKRFVFLGVTADFSVTPSQVIDTVWHEHILFTKGYSDFCTDVIGCEFNHYPELLPTNKQTALYKKQYNRTLALYEHEFNTTAPEDIWGATKFGRRYLTRKKKKVLQPDDSIYSYDDAPLFTLFDASDVGDGGHSGFDGFGGGDTGGGGADGDWGGDDGGDSGDSGSCGGDSGGCSSGCGGCGGGD